MSAKADVWMPLYVGDYLRDTSRLTTAQHGAYMLLLMDYWVNGPPPDDDRVLASIVRCAVDEWQDMRQALQSKFNVSDGVWRHSRVDRELAIAATNREVARARAKAAADARWSKLNASSNAPSIAPSIPQAMLEECPSPSPSPTSSPKKKERGCRLSPDAELTQEWEVFCRRERPDLDPKITFAKFKDYYVAKTGARSTSLDWTATWRNWVRNERSTPSMAGGLSKGAQNMAALTRGMTKANFWESSDEPKRLL